MSKVASHLRETIGAYLGQVLTPEIAAAIEVAARVQPDRSIDLTQFAPTVRHGCTIQAERFGDILDDLEPLHRAHWLETEGHRHGIVFGPDYPTLLAMERAGRLLQITARDGTGIVAHVRMFLYVSTHTSTLGANEDTLYLRLDRRPNPYLMLDVMRYAEAALKKLGAIEIGANSKLVNNAGVLMRRLGYKPVATQFHKSMDRASP